MMGRGMLGRIAAAVAGLMVRPAPPMSLRGGTLAPQRASVRGAAESLRVAAPSVRQRERAAAAWRAGAQWCADNMGRGFDAPPAPAAWGYFWKQDAGAADRPGLLRLWNAPPARPLQWRLYRVRP